MTTEKSKLAAFLNAARKNRPQTKIDWASVTNSDKKDPIQKLRQRRSLTEILGQHKLGLTPEQLRIVNGTHPSRLVYDEDEEPKWLEE